MSKLSSSFRFSGTVAIAMAASFMLPSMAAKAQDEAVQLDDPAMQQAAAPWPVQVIDGGRTFLIYQPQVDKWDNNQLEGRSAVSVRDETGRQNFGVAYFSARTETDVTSRMVTVADPQVARVDFPAVTGGADAYLPVLREQFAGQSWQIPQDRLQSDMEIDKLAQQSARQPLKNDPPRIVYSDRPAVLVPVDGNPVLRPVGDTGFVRAVNTRALLLQEKSGSRWFLFVSDHWMQAQSLQGPWSVANPSAQLEQAKLIVTQEGEVDLLQSDAGDAATPSVSAPAAITSVFVSTAPTELLQTDGPPQYAPIERTQLLYVTNSPDKLFLDLRTQNHYALISGRWYRTTALAQGQWSYVAPASLPADFAMIPPDHPTESVRAAVPGTPQAREAVIASSVPQVATVARGTAQLQVNYDGNPSFQPIDGTSLQSAVNAPVPVIRVSESAFYALDNGVWFVASSPFGPWTVASFVPPVVYSIPPSSPLYNVTFVRVYDATPETVYVGYTPGYVGSYVSNNVVVYGTGWPYSPWIGSAWYGAPVTWGFGFSFFNSWWHPYPWHAWHRTAWAAPRARFNPWWGPWHSPLPGRAFVAGGPRFAGSFGPPAHNVGRIYDRWDHRDVVWNGPRANVNRPREFERGGPRPGFTAQRDGHWNGRDNDGVRDGRLGNNPVRPSAVQVPRSVQTQPGFNSWNRSRPENDARVQGQQPQRPSQSFGENERRREGMQQDRGFSASPRMQPQQRVAPAASEQAQRAPMQQAPAQIQRAPVQNRPAPAQIQRAPVQMQRPSAQLQRPSPQVRNYSPPPARIERPVSANSGRNVERNFARPQARGGEGRSQSSGGGGHGGGWQGGGGHR